MKLRMAATLTVLCGSLMTTSDAQRVTADGAGQTLDYLANQYFEQVYFKYMPTAGTSPS